MCLKVKTHDIIHIIHHKLCMCIHYVSNKYLLLFSDCSNTVALTKLDDPVSCLLSSECTYIECCVDVHFIPRSFMFYLHIDPCEYQITVGIEKFFRNISLINYRWGEYIFEGKWRDINAMICVRHFACLHGSQDHYDLLQTQYVRRFCYRYLFSQ